MADSFADLWTPSSKPTPPPQKLGLATNDSQLNNGLKRPQQDVFSLLSSAGSSAPGSRPLTPSSMNPTPKAAQAAPKPGLSGDAFSSLLPGSIGTSNTATMTIAEQAALAQKRKMDDYLKKHDQARVQAVAWDELDSLVVPGNTSTAGIGSQAKGSGDDGWGFGMLASGSSGSASTNKVSQPAEDDDWGLGDFAAGPSNTRISAPAPPSQSIWDFDEFASPVADAFHTSPRVPRSSSPRGFDIGNCEGTILDNDLHDDDDILGVLSKPVDAILKGMTPSISNISGATPSRPQNPQSRSSSRSASPPPHIVGQIVEMGFSPQQARIALAATDTGLDVQAALETLLANGVGSDDQEREQPPEREDGLRSRTASDESPRRWQRPSYNRTISNRDTPSPFSSQQDRNVQLQDQADKLLAQASEIGLSVFNRANAFWNQGKEKAQKLYEERAAAAASKGGPPNDGRPRWMQDTNVEVNLGEHERGTNRKGGGGFVDSDNDDAEVLPSKLPVRSGPLGQKVVDFQSTALTNTRDLFSDVPSTYVSPFRHGRPKPRNASSSSTSTPQTPSPIQIVQRQAVPASSSAITTSAKYKEYGTAKYKLGQFGEAEAAYSSAIAALPNSHLLLVPLYNNRALTRIKMGIQSGAVDDCTAVIELIGVSYNPAHEVKVTREECGASVSLADGLVKALRRRAEAWEGREKWDEARKDWEVLGGTGWAPGNARSEAVRGVGRCRKMAKANLDAVSDIKSKPDLLPTRPSARPGGSTPSQALNKLREATNAQEAEDQERHELKDTVDARLIAWKGGKETNIRALIASLHIVLWPELGWQKVGMAEVVTPSQVKIRYTKAIAKLHPDKLNANNTTLEQRMIANGVFGALNEAWNAFKQ